MRGAAAPLFALWLVAADWTFGPNGYTASETVEPNGRTGSDNRGNTWTEHDGILLFNGGHGCTMRGWNKQCW